MALYREVSRSQFLQARKTLDDMIQEWNVRPQKCFYACDADQVKAMFQRMYFNTTALRDKVEALTRRLALADGAFRRYKSHWADTRSRYERYRIAAWRSAGITFSKELQRLDELQARGILTVKPDCAQYAKIRLAYFCVLEGILKTTGVNMEAYLSRIAAGNIPHDLTPVEKLVVEGPLYVPPGGNAAGVDFDGAWKANNPPKGGKG